MISAVVRVYNDAQHIENCLNAIYDFLDEIVIIEGVWQSVLKQNLPGYNTQRSNDGTIEKIESFINERDVDDKIIVYQLTGQEEYEEPFDTYPMVFWDLTKCKVGDYALIVDADEIYLKEDVQKIVDFIQKEEPHKIVVNEYILTGVDTYRSDSTTRGIGGRIVEWGRFDTDRHFYSPGAAPISIVPDVVCFHYSLYKPVEHLHFKNVAYGLSVQDFWVMKDDKVVLVNNLKELKYNGPLPEGYSRV
jgi:hypothetical protein